MTRSPDPPDRIDEHLHVETTVEAAWDFAGEPGWFINDGSLTRHELRWDGERVEVEDPRHGCSTFERLAHEPPNRLALRALESDGTPGRTVEITVTPADDGCTLRVFETGFAAMPVPPPAQWAQHEQNTRTWRHQLSLAKDCLEQERGSTSRGSPTPRV